MRRSGFTLIELLVAIAIIALLIAILIPSLSRARMVARTTVCASNLHQLGNALTTYLDAWDGRFWRYYSDQSAAAPGGAGRQWWFGFEPNGPGATGSSNRPLDKSLSPLGPYTANLAGLLQCPDFPYSEPGFFHKFDQRAASYGYNIKLGPVGGNTANRNQFADRASSVFVFADGIHFDFGSFFNEGHYLLYTANAAGPSGYAHFRHRISGRWHAQVTFLDGHVESQAVAPPTSRSVGGMPSGNLVSASGTNSIYGY